MARDSDSVPSDHNRSLWNVFFRQTTGRAVHCATSKPNDECQPCLTTQGRRHRACEVERLLNAPGAKKQYRNEF